MRYRLAVNVMAIGMVRKESAQGALMKLKRF